MNMARRKRTTTPTTWWSADYSASFNGAADAYAANQYTLAGDDAPEYGPGGWLTASGGLEYWFDDEDRLGSVFDEGTLRETVSRYDHLHRRMARHTVTWFPDYSACVTNAGRVFAYDGWNLVREWRTDGAGATNVLDYCWGLDLSGTLGGAGGIGGLLAVSVGGDFYLPLYDANGNVTAYIDESGNTVAQYTYDAFGNTISQSGALADAFPFRFSTRYFDAETGFYYYGLRHYSPKWGRWISRDPIGGDGGLNLYAFCANDPVNRFDVMGLIPLSNSVKQSLYDFISKNANIQGNVSKRLLHHYMFDNGETFLLTLSDVREIKPFANLKRNKHFMNQVKISKRYKIPKFNGEYIIEASTDLSGSLGSFGMKSKWTVIVCPFKNSEKFNAKGTAEIFDKWDFDWNIVKNIRSIFTGERSRNPMSQARTILGSFIPGEAFEVRSVTFSVQQNSSKDFITNE